MRMRLGAAALLAGIFLCMPGHCQEPQPKQNATPLDFATLLGGEPIPSFSFDGLLGPTDPAAADLTTTPAGPAPLSFANLLTLSAATLVTVPAKPPAAQSPAPPTKFVTPAVGEYAAPAPEDLAEGLQLARAHKTKSKTKTYVTTTESRPQTLPPAPPGPPRVVTVENFATERIYTGSDCPSCRSGGRRRR